MDFNQLFFKYAVYYPTVAVRGEWFAGYGRQFQDSQFFPVEQREAAQLGKLNQLLVQAQSSPYYMRRLPVGPLSNLADLVSLPTLAKGALRSADCELGTGFNTFRNMSKTSGGSTGAPVTLLKNNAAMAQEMAAVWRGYSWAGVDVGDRQARFWGVPHSSSQRWRARLIDLVSNRSRCSAFAFNEQDLAAYTQRLIRFKPKYFYGYVSMISRFADYIDSQFGYSPIDLQAIITTAEVLSDSSRQHIERVFGCKVYNEYGCGEVGTIAHECEHGSLHLNSENLILEVLDENENVLPAGEEGQFCVTELNNYSTPLIRYLIKDFGSISNTPCPCGRTLPVLNNIRGREYDYLISSAGKRYHPEYFLYVFEDLKKQGAVFSQLQVVQHEPLKVSINLAGANELAVEVKASIEARFREALSDQCEIFFNRLPSIERERSGKLRVIKREFEAA